jgi:hypothetical protein
MRLRRRLTKVEGVLGRLPLEGERRQEQELAAWLRTLSDDELEAVHREAERRLQQEGDDADP